MVAKLAIHREAHGARFQQCCGPEGTGRFNDSPYPARWCVGAECMAWRWYETHVRNGEQAQPNAAYGLNELLSNGETYGFCGLAGDPTPKGR